jgi:hypothetical protein
MFAQEATAAGEVVSSAFGFTWCSKNKPANLLAELFVFQTCSTPYK